MDKDIDNYWRSKFPGISDEDWEKKKAEIDEAFAPLDKMFGNLDGLFGTNIFSSSYNPKPATAKYIDTINGVLSEYSQRLTLRQLYYQLVSRNIIPNKDREYKKLSEIATKARKAGMIDWQAIEDRLRKPQLPYYADDLADALNDIYNSYRLDRMEGQRRYIEVWVEKDSLSGVLLPITQKYHVRLMVNRGYSSITAMYEASERMGEDPLILYFGDHDPSGLDMIRDIEDRLYEMGTPVTVEPVALTMAQIRHYNPPPNPAKLSDTRSPHYVAQYGYESWELDALPPDVLSELVEEAILSRIDLDKYNKVLEQEKADKTELKKLINKK